MSTKPIKPFETGSARSCSVGRAWRNLVLFLAIGVIGMGAWPALGAAEEDGAEPEVADGEQSAGTPEPEVAEQADGNQLPGDRELIYEADNELLERVLTEMGIEFEKIDDFVWSFELGDYSVVLLSDTVDIQLYMGMAGAAASLQRINLWNMEHRFSRAYLDDDLDPCIEADLDFEGGVSVGSIKQFIRLFEDAIAAFDRHLH